MRIIQKRGEIRLFARVSSSVGTGLLFLFLEELPVVFRQEIPVPGIDNELVFLPVELIVWRAPFTPKEVLILFFPIFSLIPGAIFIVFLKRKAITSLPKQRSLYMMIVITLDCNLYFLKRRWCTTG